MSSLVKYIKAPAAGSAVQFAEQELRKVEKSNDSFFNSLEELQEMALSLESGSFVVTLTGCTTSPQTTARYARSGKLVLITIPVLRATSNTTACTVTGIPSALLPTAGQSFPVFFTNNNNNLFALAVTDKATGTITFADSTGNANGFTAANLKGPNNITLQLVLE